MEFDFESFDYAMNEEVFDVAFMLVGFLLIFALIALVVGFVMYILQSVGLYTIAKRRGIKHAWLAWIPVGMYWLVGCISDQYRYVAKGEVKNRRTVMLVLSAVSTVLSGVGSALSSAGAFAMMEQVSNAGAQMTEGIVAGSSYGISMLVSLIGAGVSLALVVFWFIALYDIYTSCNPKNNVVFLVLGIIFSFLNAIFLFANRNKDGGMPPRKQPAPSNIPDAQWQPAQSPREPWENSDE